MAPRLELFPFRYRDPLTGKWRRARYAAELRVIAERHAEFQIIGPGEIREADPDARYFTPHQKATTYAESDRITEAPLELQSLAIDALEAFLVRLFLRRYVTYCARHRRFAAMNGAARLYMEVRSPVARLLSNLGPIRALARPAELRRVAIAGVAV